MCAQSWAAHHPLSALPPAALFLSFLLAEFHERNL